MTATQQIEVIREKDNPDICDGKRALREKIARLEEINRNLMKRCIAAEEATTAERLKKEAAEAIIEDLRTNGPRISIKADAGEVSIVAVVAGQKWGAEQRWTVFDFKEALGI